MKTSWIIGVIVALLAALTLSANRIAARAIAAELPEALTTSMGQQVTLTNVSANLWRLQAQAEELKLGEPGQPSAVFRNLSIELDATELLAGRIHLVEAASDTTDIYPQRWPVRTSSEPVDLSGIKRWIPEVVHVNLLQLLDDEKVTQTFADFSWQITGENARKVSWSEPSDTGQFQFELSTEDLNPIFAGQSAQLQFKVLQQAKSKSDVETLLSADLVSKPADAGRFATLINFHSPAFQGDWSFTTAGLFTVPTSSRLQLQSISPYKLSELAPIFAGDPAPHSGSSAAGEASDFMKRALPVLLLPEHSLELQITEVALDDEKIQQLKANVALHSATADQPSRLEITELSAVLPRSDLKGGLTIEVANEWSAQLHADFVTSSLEPEALRGFESTDWLWNTGQMALATQGSTLLDLIDNARGEVDISGVFRTSKEVPVTLKAHLNDRKGRIGADDLEFTLGSSAVSGSVWIDGDRKNLVIRLHSDNFDVTELIAPAEADASSEPGIAIPEYGWWDSQMKIDARVTSDVVRLPGTALTAFDAKLTRGPQGERLDLSFSSERAGGLHAQVQTARKGDLRNLDLNLQLTELAARAVALDTAATISGGLRAQGSGASLRELVKGLNSRVSATADFDKTEGNLQLSGNPILLLQDDRIVGFSFNNIRIANTKEPLVAGNFTYDERIPLFRGELNADHFDLDKLLAVFPAPAQSDKELELAELLNRLPHLALTLSTQSLQALGNKLLGFSVSLKSQPGQVDLVSLQFRSDFGDLQASALLREDNKLAQFEVDAKVGGVLLGSLLQKKLDQAPQLKNPVAGTIKVTTSGDDWQSLTSNLRGAVDLQSLAGTSPDNRLNLDLVIEPVGAGIQAKFNDVSYGLSNLKGEAAFQPGDIPRLQLDLTSDYLNLADWQRLVGEELKPLEEKLEGGSSADKHDVPNSVFELADDSFRVLTGMLRSPLRLLGFGRGEKTKKFFSDKPFELEAFSRIDIDLQLKLDRLISPVTDAKGVVLDASINNGLVNVKLDADEINGGTSKAEIRIDTKAQPPTISLLGDVRDFQIDNKPAFASRSAFIDLTSAGNNEAALAAAMNGEVFTKIGEGESDMAELGLGFFSTSLLNQVFGALLPDRSNTPMLKCALAYAVVTDGVIVTPKAAVMQTREANVLVRAEINLRTEGLAIQFDSRTRTGAGISVGNIFSNTVRVRGTIQNPTLVPNAAGIAWRSWAALATGGLSLLGEGFIKRVLASEHACENLHADVVKLVCSGSSSAAKSTLVCPAA